MKGQPKAVPNLREIMDMEVALAQYKVDISDWKKETPDDMASRLSRQKLLQLFPDIDPEVVLEVLNAHNNNFDQTCQVGIMCQYFYQALQCRLFQRNISYRPACFDAMYALVKLHGTHMRHPRTGIATDGSHV